GSLHFALEGTKHQPNIHVDNMQKINRYWEEVREYYADFETGIHTANTEVYQHQMPGGQYTNHEQQSKAEGHEDKWDDVKDMYSTVNEMFGDVIKVTPSSKVVGDMALFMVQNKLTEADVYERGHDLSFPESVVSFFKGDLGQPVGGFPRKL